MLGRVVDGGVWRRYILVGGLYSRGEIVEERLVDRKIVLGGWVYSKRLRREGKVCRVWGVGGGEGFLVRWSLEVFVRM